MSQSDLTTYGFINSRTIEVVLMVSWHPEGWAWDAHVPGPNPNRMGHAASTEQFKAWLKDLIAKNPNALFNIFVKPISERDCLQEVMDIIKEAGGKLIDDEPFGMDEENGGNNESEEA